ncbi:MAG: HAD-IIIA family hydrolase [Lachnospiraceae bacterium]|jgi:D-glycero-D-manno-heptose 1,7-bisphosphate phosphatase|nr:HAD-IIIA family hydrolase [Lachnospiraceae bacterium]
MDKAVFIDRDGVINRLVYYPDQDEYESPRTRADFRVYPFVREALTLLREAGFHLFVVSNQPSYAKGKMTLADVQEIEKVAERRLNRREKLIDEFYYCYHHPQAVIPEYAVECNCRKPHTHFPEQAVAQYHLDSAKCFFIGDQDTDIMCGQAMGFSTIRIENKCSCHKCGLIEPHITAKNLLEAAHLICEEEAGAYERVYQSVS